MQNSENVLDLDNFDKRKDIEVQYIISLTSFIILSVITFGLYDLWWIYKSWRFFQQKYKWDIIPFWRTVFSILFLYNLFLCILDLAKQKNYPKNYHLGLIYCGFFAGNILAWLPKPYGMISILSFVFLIPPFKAFNFARQNSTEITVIEQNFFNTKQIVLLVLGTILWLLILFGGLNFESGFVIK
jgi:hypothetical protein